MEKGLINFILFFSERLGNDGKGSGEDHSSGCVLGNLLASISGRFALMLLTETEEGRGNAAR